MLNHRVSNISLSAFMSAGGTAGGYAITYKLAGYDGAQSFLCFCAYTLATLLTVQAILGIKSAVRAVYLVLFNICFILGIVWFMLCLILPMFWIPTIDMSAKLLLSVASVILCSVNISKGVELFKLRWNRVGAELLSRYYDQKHSVIEWSDMVGGLRMAVSIYIPGVPEKLNSIISVAVVLSMIVGLSLRNAFPLFSLFAWGIPIVIVVSLVVQMIGFGIGQLLVLTALEKKDRNIIRPL